MAGWQNARLRNAKSTKCLFDDEIPKLRNDHFDKMPSCYCGQNVKIKKAKCQVVNAKLA
jgi:hypothetical protein